ncbi:SGNH/GDSL hydrolase family protein [Yinghuangia soli]|uniref:GDSL-type esterase/lipase family protein n=1 Tax=Yinghuangia soli TaxID=2908204 RepID=A0AA41U3Y6_9ACTN|nr:SGNH/GDSL hydrolase family protein [Yinghuangia soli]MCF2528524.1 GDSL-type esterase/lipase family protein [Yinghuangia soli]
MHEGRWGLRRTAPRRYRRAAGLLAALALAATAACATGSGGDRGTLPGAEDGLQARVQPTGTASAAPPAPSSAAPAKAPSSAAPSSFAPSSSAPAAGPFPRPRSMAALGDSITRGFDACSIPLKDCPSKSWATGDDVDSIARRLGLPSSAVFNDARTGARMNDLAGQARTAVGQHVEYVTVLMGANDACRDREDQMTPVSEFEAQLREGLGVLRNGLPGVRVLLVSVPDVIRLWEVAHGERLARAVWSRGVCQTALSDPESTKRDDVDRRQRVRDRVTAYNDVLRRVCAEWPGQCRYDGGAVNRHKFTKGDLSDWDWFHPSGQGHGIIAKLASEAGFRWQ